MVPAVEFDKEGLPVPPKKGKISFDADGLPVPPQKKNQVVSTSGGKAGTLEAPLPSGGPLPTGLTPSKVKITEYKEPQVPVINVGEDPVKAASYKVTDLSKLMQRQAKPTISTTAVVKTAPVKQEIGKEIKKEQVQSAKAKVELDKTVKAFKDDANLSASFLVQSGKLRNPNEIDVLSREQILSLADPTNETQRIAVNTLVDAKNARTAVKNARNLEEAAILYAGATDPQVQRQIDISSQTVPTTLQETLAGTGKKTFDPNEMFAEATRGRMLYQLVSNPVAFEEINKNPALKQEVQNTFPLLIQKYPDFGKMYLGQKISQKMEDMGINNAILNIVTEKETDDAVNALVSEGKMTENEKNFYNKYLRGEGGFTDFGRKILGRQIYDTPGLVESTLSGAGTGVLALGKGVSEITGLRRALVGEQKMVGRDIAEKDLATNVAPKGIIHEITKYGGQFLGQSLSIGGGGKILTALKAVKSVPTAAAIAGGLQAYANYIPDARQRFPGEELKQRGYATVLATLEAATENIFRDQKVIDGLLGKMKPEVGKVIQDFTSKKISAEAAKQALTGKIKDALSKIPEAAKYYGKGIVENTAEEVAAQLGQQITAGVFENKPIDEWINGQELFDTGRQSFLGSAFVAGLSARADMAKNRGITAKMIYGMAENPDYWAAKIQEAAKLDPDRAAEAQDQLDNLAYASKVYQDVQGQNMSEKQKIKYVINALEAKVKKAQADAITDPVLKKKAQAEAAVLEADQEALLDGTDQGDIEGDVSDKVVVGEEVPFEGIKLEIPEPKITDEEYNEFVDKGIVTPERLNDIARKVRNKEELSEQEQAIFTDKTGEINTILSREEVASKEAAPQAPADIEAKKADIERRRQEELKKINQRIEKLNQREDTRVKIETYRTLDINDNPVEVEITTNKDGSRVLKARQINEDGTIESIAYVTERINNKAQLSLTNEKLIEGYIGNEGNTLQRTNLDENPDQTYIDKINAKYDAELKALETGEVKPEVPAAPKAPAVAPVESRKVEEVVGEEVTPELPAAPVITKVKSPKEVKQGDTVIWRGEEFKVDDINDKGGFNLTNKKDPTWTVKDARITDEEFEGKSGEVKKPISDVVADDLLSFMGMPKKGEVKFSKKTGQPEAIKQVDEKESEIVGQMNSMNLVNEGVDLDAPSTTKEKIDIEELNSRLDTPLEKIDWNDYQGIPFTFTISDQLRSGDVVNPSTGEVIADLKGGIGFNGTKGNEGNAWANTSKDEADALLSRALDVYNANKALFEKLWAEGKLPNGHIPVAVVKMAESSILSNEAVFRVGIQNIKTLPERNRQKAVVVLNKTLKQKVAQTSKDIKRGTDAKTGVPYSENTLKAKKKLLAQYNRILDVVNKYGYKDIVEILEDSKHFSLPEKAIITGEVFYGAPTPIGGKPIDIARSRPSTPVSIALIGNKNPELINIGRITDLLTEPSMKNVPNMHIVSIVGVDVKNPESRNVDHQNYPYGVKGQSIGILERPVHMKDAFGEAYGSALSQVTKNEANNASINVKQAMTQGIPVQAGLPNRIFKPAIAQGKLDAVDKLAGFLRQAFPSTTFFTSQEAWDAAMAEPSIKKKLKDGEVVYAFTTDGNVFINPNLKTTKAALHETGHIWMGFVRDTNPELHNKGLSLVDGTKEYQKAKEQYGDTPLAREEALMELMSSKGDTIINASQKAKFKEWLLSLYKYIADNFKSLIGLSPKEIENLTLDKFLEGMLADILSGKEITTKKIKGEVKLSAESKIDRVKKFIEIQKANGISDADIKEGIKKVAESIGLTKNEVNNLFKPEAYAVQEPTTGKVPIQPEAGVSEEVEGGVPPTEPKKATKESKAESEKELDRLANNVPDTGKVAEYLSKGTIVKYTGEAPANEQARGIQELGIALEHGKKIIEKAKEVFGEDYVEKTLDYIENSTASVSNKALMYVSLENELFKEKQANPDRAGEITKQQALVYAQSQALARENSLSLNYQKLRQYAIKGYDKSIVTDQLYSNQELESKKDISSAVEASPEQVNQAAEEAETEAEAKLYTEKELEQKVEQGVKAEIDKLFEQLPKKDKTRAEKALTVLADFKKKLRGRAYESTLGIPIAILDAGVTTIENAIKLGISIEKAVGLGIKKIKERWGKSWDKENDFRNEAIQAYKDAGIDTKAKTSPTTKKQIVKDALIQSGFGRTVTIKGEERQILDWKKLAGRAGTVENIQRNVENALKENGYSQEEIDNSKDEFTKEYIDLRQSIIEKAQNELARRNKSTVSPKQKSAAKRLAELYTFGLFEQDRDEFDNLINSALGVQFDEKTFKEANKIAEAMENFYNQSFNGVRLNDLTGKSALENLNDKIRLLTVELSKKQGPWYFRAVSLLKGYMNFAQTMILNTIKNSTENLSSGAQQKLIDKLFLTLSKETTPELIKERRRLMRDIYKDMILNGGIGYGKVENEFVNRRHIDDYVNRLSDKKLVQGIASVLTGKATLNAMDAMFKAGLTEARFTSNLVKILISPSNKNRMTKEEAVKFVSEQLTGQTIEDARVTAKDVIDKINKDAGQELIKPTKEQINRLANDIVKAALEMNGTITSEQMIAAYNAAYRSAGLSIGHESNNMLTSQLRAWSANIESNINRSIKEKEWANATLWLLNSIFINNIASPFVGGGTNWLILKLEKTGLGLFTGLAYEASGKKELDLTTRTGLDQLERRLFTQSRAKDSYMRGAVGGLTSLLLYAGFMGIADEDEYRKWRGKNRWATKYLDLITPEYLLASMSAKDKRLPQYVESSLLGKNDAFSITTKVVKSVNYAMKGDSPKTWGAIGETIGARLNAPLPWRLVRDGQILYDGIRGEDPYHGNYKPSIGFWSGVLQGGAIEWVGLRPMGKGKVQVGSFKVVDSQTEEERDATNEELKQVEYLSNILYKQYLPTYKNNAEDIWVAVGDKVKISKEGYSKKEVALWEEKFYNQLTKEQQDQLDELVQKKALKDAKIELGLKQKTE